MPRQHEAANEKVSSLCLVSMVWSCTLIFHALIVIITPSVRLHPFIHSISVRVKLFVVSVRLQFQ